MNRASWSKCYNSGIVEEPLTGNDNVWTNMTKVKLLSWSSSAEDIRLKAGYEVLTLKQYPHSLPGCQSWHGPQEKTLTWRNWLALTSLHVQTELYVNLIKSKACGYHQVMVVFANYTKEATQGRYKKAIQRQVTSNSLLRNRRCNCHQRQIHVSFQQ